MRPEETNSQALAVARPAIDADPERAASARDASYGSAIRLGAEVVVRTSSIVATLWLTRSMGVASFGAFVLALSIGLILAELCDLGLNAIVVPLVVRSPRNLRSLLVLKALMTLGVVAAGALFIPLASEISGEGPMVLLLCTIHFLGATWIEMAGTALRALGHRVDEALLLFAFRFALVALVVSAPFGLTTMGAALSYAAAVLPALLLSAWLLWSRRPMEPAPSPSTSIRAILRQAAPMGVNGYLSIFSTRVELFLLQAFHGAAIVGLFGGALKIVESLLTLPSAIAAGALPSVTRDVLQGSRGAAQRTFGMVVWLGVPAAVGLSLCATDVLQILGPGFVLGAPALRILSVALLLCFGNAALFHVLIAAGETGVIPRLTALRVLAAVVLGLLLIPSFGQAGAALSFTGAELLLFGMLARKTQDRARVDVLRPLASAFQATLPMAAVLVLWPLPLAKSVLLGGLLFSLGGALVLRRGAEANGLA